MGTSARVKSYQLVKVVSGGRACGKSLILASSQLLVIEWSHCFGAVRLEKVWFLFQGPYTGCYCLVAAAWLLLLACLPACLLACLPACCLSAACLLLACCLPAACPLLLACGLPAVCLLLLPAAAATADHCWILVQTFYPARKQQSRSPCLALAGGTGGRHQQIKGTCMFLAGLKKRLQATATGNRWVDRIAHFLRAVHDFDAHRANHRFCCGKTRGPYIPIS